MLVGFLAVGMRPDVSVTKTHVVLLAGLIYYYIAIRRLTAVCDTGLQRAV